MMLSLHLQQTPYPISSIFFFNKVARDSYFLAIMVIAIFMEAGISDVGFLVEPSLFIVYPRASQMNFNECLLLI